jgi:mRNA-degrading endonuclease RelE of RelBE toxin-antitoxin system
MPPVRYVFVGQAERDFARLPSRMRQRVVSALDRYLEDQRTGDIKKLTGAGDEWRLRVGDVRVRFRYSEDGRTLIVL